MVMTVKTKARELDVYVNGARVGYVVDCGDCWRAFLYGRRRRRFLPDCETRGEAVRSVIRSAAVPRDVW